MHVDIERDSLPLCDIFSLSIDHILFLLFLPQIGAEIVSPFILLLEYNNAAIIIPSGK